MTRTLDASEVAQGLVALPGWTGGTEAITAEYEFDGFPVAIRAVDQVAVEAEELDHHPDIDIRWRRVRFALTTHSAGGVTQLDIELAHRIHAIAEAAGTRGREES